MIKYITVIDTPTITLDLMGRKKVFSNDEEVHEDIYTKAYPKYFKRLGEIKGYNGYLTTPIFIPDTIHDFMAKEELRISTKPKESPKELPKEVKIDELALAAEEFNIDTGVTIETEE